MSNGDAIAALHMHHGMVWRHLIDKQWSILHILHRLRQFNKIDRMPISTTYFRKKSFFLVKFWASFCWKLC